MGKTPTPQQPRAASLPATKQAQVAYTATAPLKHRSALAKSFTGGLSPRGAIRVKCLTCANFQRDEVAGCRVVTCPLWPIRPYRSTQEKAALAGAAEKSNEQVRV